MSNTSFEEQLDKMDFFQSHPSLKPFIGKNYTENDAGIRILLVGESHYVENPLPQITRESLLNDWWSENPPLINDISWYTTRGTIQNFMSGDSVRSYSLFREPCKVYNDCFLHGKYQSKEEIRSLFDSFAYMNYFQMPALYERISLWKSLLIFNNETNKVHPLSSEIWDKTEKISNEVFLSVAEILKPDKIVFLSTEAYNAFKRQNKTYDADKSFATVHPTCAWWNRKMKSGFTGKEALINFFTSLASQRKSI